LLKNNYFSGKSSKPELTEQPSLDEVTSKDDLGSMTSERDDESSASVKRRKVQFKEEVSLIISILE